MASFWEYPDFCSRCVVPFDDDVDDDDPASLPLVARVVTTRDGDEEDEGEER